MTKGRNNLWDGIVFSKGHDQNVNIEIYCRDGLLWKTIETKPSSPLGMISSDNYRTHTNHILLVIKDKRVNKDTKRARGIDG